ncbi:molybdopterin-binding protein [Chloroflexota bacterium]
MLSKRNISRRNNKLKGNVKAMYVGQAMVEVVISIGDVDVVSMVSRDAARRMGLKVGDPATAVISPAEVMLRTG